MRLTRLNIEHFRGITSMEIDFEREVTVLIGENNSGKTSVLEAIRFGLDSIKSNKRCVFTEFDFQRSSPESILAESPAIVFTFFFEETEEPEAHLHPGAIRSVWSIINDLPGQKIIVTHSGDILSEVPIHSIRRLSTTSGSCACNFIPDGVLDPEELRKFNHHVRRNRGELLFARTWLLVEGETDVSVFVECAEIFGINLHQLGIRVVEYSQVDLKIFIKAADAFGIQWHVVADNDDGGQKYIDAAKALLGDREENDCITKLTSQNTDILLCRSGYGQPYRDGVTYKKESMLTAPVGSDEYWSQVYDIVNKLRFSKPAAAFDALEIMRTTGAEGVPAEIVDIFKKIISQPGDN